MWQRVICFGTHITYKEVIKMFVQKINENWKRVLFLVSLFLFVLIFSESKALAQTRLQFSLGGVTGTTYTTGAALAKFINDHSNKIKITPNTSGGGLENIRRVSSGMAQLGQTSCDLMHWAWYGEKPFEKPMRDFRVIGVGSVPIVNHIVSLDQNNIKTVADLKGKVFAIGAPGSAAALYLSLFLDHLGLKKDIDIRILPHQDYPTMLLDGKIDAFNRAGSVPQAVITEIGVQKKIALVDLAPEIEQSGFLKKYPFFLKHVIKGGTYKGEDRDITTFGIIAFWVASKDLPEDVVYEFTKLAYSQEAINWVSMAAKGYKDINLKAPLEGNIGPVHPGAAKYWKEHGIQIPEPVLK
jgi:TRAP transporter TAXI family solute receptor